MIIIYCMHTIVVQDQLRLHVAYWIQSETPWNVGMMDMPLYFIKMLKYNVSVKYGLIHTVGTTDNNTYSVEHTENAIVLN